MAITVTRSRVKEKCAIADSDFDSTIDNLIAEFVPVIEYSLLDSFLADDANAGLQATLNLGAVEIICGEFLAQQSREFGATDTIHLGDVTLHPGCGCFGDLIAGGWNRLRPYLKLDPVWAVANGGGGGVRIGATTKNPEEPVV